MLGIAFPCEQSRVIGDFIHRHAVGFKASQLQGGERLEIHVFAGIAGSFPADGLDAALVFGSDAQVGQLVGLSASNGIIGPGRIVAHGRTNADTVISRRSGPAQAGRVAGDVRYGHIRNGVAFHTAGGVLVYGIPEFRLPKKIVQSEVDRLIQSGVKIETNTVVGRTWTLNELREKFDAVFIANGAGLPVFMNVPGENLKGVYSANEYLTRVNLMGAWKFPESDTPVISGKRVCVVGGGNVAMDAVRTAKRLGAEEAIIVYRRSKTEMPARVEEVHHAEAEGIRFEMLTAPLEVQGNETHWVSGLKCQRMELGEPDASGRRRPVPIPGSEFVIPCDVVVVAIGTRANPLLTATCPEMKLNRKGNIEVDENGMTSIPGVFAGGDIVRGAATVILAMGDGKRTAAAIDNYLSSK